MNELSIKQRKAITMSKDFPKEYYYIFLREEHSKTFRNFTSNVLCFSADALVCEAIKNGWHLFGCWHNGEKIS